jgi:predicted kinase
VARTAGAAFELVTCAAPDDVLRERIARRHAARDDASEAGADVLELQRHTGDALGDDERIHCACLDTTHGMEWKGTIESLARRFHASRP